MTDKEKHIEDVATFINEHSPLTWLSSIDLAEDLYSANYLDRHIGKWLTDKYGMERSICSICGAVFEGDGGNYCRNCGARMTEDI